jgi:hypothetical protein
MSVFTGDGADSIHMTTDTDTQTFYRVKAVVGIKTYGEGATEEEALADVRKKVLGPLLEIPEIEEHVLKAAVVKTEVEPKKLTFKQMIKDRW